ncbi:MAG: hypothetical protein GY787_23875 [Alteromonadales bacterium]|nr:hypothetical protein [Alteromonadales bacterium]
MELTVRDYANVNNAKLVCVNNANAKIMSERTPVGDYFFGDFGRVIAILEVEDLNMTSDTKRTIPAYLMRNCGVYTLC